MSLQTSGDCSNSIIKNVSITLTDIKSVLNVANLLVNDFIEEDSDIVDSFKKEEPVLNRYLQANAVVSYNNGVVIRTSTVMFSESWVNANYLSQM